MVIRGVENVLVVIASMGSCGVLAETPETAKRGASEIQATGSEKCMIDLYQKAYAIFKIID